MSLKVFCGPFSPVLEEAFLARLAELAPGPGRAVAVVAPSRRLAERLERLVAAERGLALLNLRFHTFHSLALEALESVGGPSARWIGDGLFHDKILDRLLADAGAKPSRGLAAAYRSSLRDLIDAGVEPKQFREHLEGLIPDPADRRRLEALVGLEAAYRRRLEQAHLLAPSGLAREAAESASSGKAASLAAYRELVYYGFYDLTGTQADFFEAVTGAYPSSLFFPCRKGRPGYAFAERFLEVKLGRSPATHLSAAPEATALGPALDALFTPGAQGNPRPGAFRVFSASGARDEAWLVAKEILALRSKPDAPAFAEIGVVARTLEPYRAALGQVFAENGIPYWTSSGGALLRHPAAKLILALLTLRRREFPARAVLDVIQSPQFRRDREDGFAATSEWTRAVRGLAVHSGWLQWEGRLRPFLTQDLVLGPPDGDGPRVKAKHVAGLWAWLERLRSGLAGPVGLGKDPWPDMVRHASRVAAENLVAPEPGPARVAWDAALSALESLAAFGPAAPDAGFDELLDTLEEKLRRAELPPPAPNQGVRVLDAMDARGESFRHLFLIGLQERVFPRQVREDPLLPDAVRSRLEHPGGYWLLPKLEGYAEERLLFTLLAGAARETLTCVYPRSSDEGRALVPSIYLRELCRAAGTDLESAGRVPRRPFEKLAFAGTERLSPKELSLLAARGTRPSTALLRPLGLDHELFDGCRARLPELARAGAPGPMDGLIGEPAEWLERAKARGFSPTALEAFIRCPFQFFASRLLGLGDVEEPLERGELSALSRGNLAHRVLERFHRSLVETGFWSRGDGRWEPHLERSLGEVLGRTGWRELGVYPVVWEAARKRLEERLRALVALDVARIRETGLVPWKFEEELAGRAGGVALRGRLDRVDRASDGRLWVVDYKSGKGPAKLRDALRKMRSLQPPLYLELAVASGAAGEAQIAGAALYCLEGTKEDPSAPAMVALDAPEWRALRGPLQANLADHVRRMGRGEFFIVQDERIGGACQWCSFAAVCRKSHPATARRAEGSKLMEAFKKARELPA